MFMREQLAAFALMVLLKMEGGESMMAMLFASRIILGKTNFDQVPAKLKKQVAEILIEDCGMPELVPTEFGGSAE